MRLMWPRAPETASERIVLRRGALEWGWRGSGSPAYQAEAPFPADAPVALPRRRSALVVNTGLVLLALVLVVLVGARLSVQTFRVEGVSMAPELSPGGHVLVNKLAYASIDVEFMSWLPFYDGSARVWGAPSRGDVIVFESPRDGQKLVKRIIGEPGDRIEIDALTGALLLNGVEVEEPYTAGTNLCDPACGPWVVREGHYFVMGDNREASSDSRQGWTVPEKNIVGKVQLTYWDDEGLTLKVIESRPVGQPEPQN